MQKRFFIVMITALLLVTGACRKSDGGPAMEEMPVQQEIEIKGDSMLYGLSCDGTTDSVVVIWPFSGDPVTLNCIEAKQAGRIIGKPQIGDWIGVMRNPEDSTEATMVINLDQLKGTWTYPVMPVMKDLQHMSKRMQKRMMENMPDSVKETFFVPREYGFTLKRGHVAVPVGRVMRANSLEDDSPVQYPDVRNYKGWYMLNGKLILVSGERTVLAAANQKHEPDVLDTLQFEYMDEDSLILVHHNMRYGFHRKANALEANALATKAQAKQDMRK
ncbi:MAG: hypothetical protein KBT34_01035 [Prevotella sp.]|nr:hypothetical protein [Candidatus Prevotella equi]